VDVRLVREDYLLGSAGTVVANRAWVGSDPAFWILYSDVLTNTNLNRISEFHSRHGAVATLGLYNVPDPSRCGVSIMDQRVSSWSSKKSLKSREAIGPSPDS